MITTWSDFEIEDLSPEEQIVLREWRFTNYLRLSALIEEYEFRAIDRGYIQYLIPGRVTYKSEIKLSTSDINLSIFEP